MKTNERLPKIQQNPRLPAIFAALGMLLMTTACGFQLAGTTPGEAIFDQVYVDDRVGIQQLIDQPVSSRIKADLSRYSLDVMDGAHAGIPGIVILAETEIEAGVSLSSGLYDRQIEIEKRVQYQFFNANGDMLVSDSISSTGQFNQNKDNPSAKTKESELLVESLNSDISRQLVRQFSFFTSDAAGITP